MATAAKKKTTTTDEAPPGTSSPLGLNPTAAPKAAAPAPVQTPPGTSTPLGLNPPNNETVATSGPPDRPAGTGAGGGTPGGTTTGPTNPGGQTGGGTGGGDSGSAQEADQSALLQIEQTLESYGFSGSALQGLVTFAWDEILNGVSPAQVALDIQNTPQFESQFPAIGLRVQMGLAPLTPAEYISIEDSYDQTLQAAGIPPSSVNFTQLIAQDVSPGEFAARIQQGYLLVAQSPPNVIQAMQDFYGVTAGQLVSYFLNPDTNEATLLRQAAAAQIGGAAIGSGFAGPGNNGGLPINQTQAETLAAQGVSYQQAQQGFSQLANEKQLYNPLPGQGTRTTFSTDDLLGAQFGSNGPAAQQLQLQAENQEAQFKGTQGVSQGTAQGGQQITGVGAFQR